MVPWPLLTPGDADYHGSSYIISLLKSVVSIATTGIRHAVRHHIAGYIGEK